MARLSRRRSFFHSEADFQHAFAWELHDLGPEWDIRLEVPIRTAAGAIHIDLLARTHDAEVAVELKYKTRALVAVDNGEQFSLTSHAAQDLGRYDFFKDLNRIEKFTQSAPGRSGWVVFLTNDSAYWKRPSAGSHGYARFAMNDGRTVSGILKWGDRASPGTRRGREKDVVVSGSHNLRWVGYSAVSARSYGEFKYLYVRAANG